MKAYNANAAFCQVRRKSAEALIIFDHFYRYQSRHLNPNVLCREWHRIGYGSGQSNQHPAAQTRRCRTCSGRSTPRCMCGSPTGRPSTSTRSPSATGAPAARSHCCRAASHSPGQASLMSLERRLASYLTALECGSDRSGELSHRIGVTFTLGIAAAGSFYRAS